ncbi:hypothetical protein SLITO_v1c07950 [Spiroplasma litorale]|uniref:Uncharacterized protein n=1 Tax=Spiroplasma litorale TaxID=216942 RepID=A0A0K1W260_9MOLU|nr:hypothetical protein [Spiroplasma litorale]AKX34414.1 hypothetical protein SLITO_v1c07950 [Spiroplasma litorale]
MDYSELLKKMRLILDDIVPLDIKYFIDFKIEKESKVEFVLVIFDKDINLFTNKENTGILNQMLPVINSDISKLNKKLVIDVEVYENYGR